MDANGSGKTTRSWHSFAKMDWLIFRRVDYVITKIILGIAVVSSVMFGFIAPVVDAVSNAPLPIPYPTTVRGGIELPRGTTHNGEVSVPLLLHDPTLGERLGQAAPNVLLAAMIIAIAWLLFQLLRSTEAREPFTRRNVRHINMMALIVGVGGTVMQFVQGFADSAILTSGRLPDSRADELIFRLPLTLFPLVVMLLLALIGEAFRRGVELREDLEGLVQLPVDEPHRVLCHLDDLLEARGMTLTALAEAVGVSLVNLSVMKNNRAKAIRYSTLTAICHVLGCQPGELLSVEQVSVEQP